MTISGVKVSISGYFKTWTVDHGLDRGLDYGPNSAGPPHDLIIHEMLREKDKATEHNRKTKTTQLAQGSYFSKKKLPRVGFEPTTVRLLGVALTN